MWHTHCCVSTWGLGSHTGASKYQLTQTPPLLSSPPSGVTLCLSDWSPRQASSRPVFPMSSFPPCRCCRAHVSRYPSTTGAGQQAAVLSSVVAQYGAAASAVHCVCRAQRQSCSPGGGATTLTAQSGAAQHENAVVSHFLVLIARFKGYLMSDRGFGAVVGGQEWGGGH